MIFHVRSFVIFPVIVCFRKSPPVHPSVSQSVASLVVHLEGCLHFSAVYFYSCYFFPDGMDMGSAQSADVIVKNCVIRVVVVGGYLGGCFVVSTFLQVKNVHNLTILRVIPD